VKEADEFRGLFITIVGGTAKHLKIEAYVSGQKLLVYSIYFIVTKILLKKSPE
jgi:hypothetical protein